MRSKMALLLVLALAVGVGGCAGYRMISVQGLTPELSLRLTSDYLVLRVENVEAQQDLYIDWDAAHLRDPRGFESPVVTAPKEPLSLIYPGGRVEYHVYPTHYYTEPDEFMWRRSSLRRHLVYEQLHATGGTYEQHLFLRLCRGGECVKADGKGVNPSGPWETVHLSGMVVASR
jgi:hypothetical protein